MGVKSATAGAKRKAPASSKPGPAKYSKKPRIQKDRREQQETDDAGDSDTDMGDDFSVSDSDSDDDGGVKVTAQKQRKDKTNGKTNGKTSDKDKDKGKKMSSRNGAPAKPEKAPETSREIHAKQKQLARERKAAKPLADELHRTKKIWERLRRKSHVPADERKQLIEELYAIITGRMKDFVLKHDAVRAVQTAVKYATAEQRKQVALELQGAYAQLAESRYAKFLIGKLMVQADSQVRDVIVSEFYGRVRRMINHPEASWILDDIYRAAATKEQKAMLLREWYGPEFAILERSNTEGATADLAQILENEPAKRGTILKYLRDMINMLVQKKMTGFTMLHDAMFQYFRNISPGSEQYTEFYELVKEDEGGDLLKNMAFTRSGSHLASLLLAHGTAKDRKQILKTYKDTFAIMSGDPFGHIVILTAFDVIDDTKLTAKAVFPELLGDTAETAAEALMGMSSNPNARATVMYLLEGPSKSVFAGALSEDLEILKEVHEVRKTTSKKDADVRTRELVAAMSPQLLSGVSSAASTLTNDSFGCQLVTEIMFSAPGDKAAALEAVAAVAAGDPDAEAEADEVTGALPHVSKTPHGGRLIKSLIAGGRYDKALGKVRPVEPPLGFAGVLYPVIEEHVVSWATGPSSFVVLNMLETEEDFAGRKALRATLKKNIKALEKAAGPADEGKARGKDGKGKKKTDAADAKQAKPSGNMGSRLLLEKLR